MGLVHVSAGLGVPDRFQGGWERAGIGPWDSIQLEPDRPEGDSFRLVTSPVRSGRRAAEFTVRQGYSRYGYNESAQAVWTSNEQQGDDYWYAWSTLFPKDWRAPDGWGTFAEWHSTLAGVPIWFDARAHSVNLMLNGGLVTNGYPQFTRRIPLLPTLSNGLWNDFVMHVKWSSGLDGRIEVWHRVARGHRFTRVAAVEHVPTLERVDGQHIGMYTLWGLYRRSYCPQPTQLSCAGAAGEQPPSVLYQDAFSRASSVRGVLEASFRERNASLVPHPQAAVGGRLHRAGAGVRLAPLAPSVDAGCGGCAVSVAGDAVHASIVGGADSADTAVWRATLGPNRPAALLVHDAIQLSRSAWMPANVSVLQLLDTHGKLVLELYLQAGSRVLSLWSPPGALRRAPINVSSGFAAPAPSAPPVSVDVLVRPGREVVLAAGGEVRVAIQGLRGGTAGRVASVRLGVDHYDSAAGSDPLEVVHTGFSASAGVWARR